MGLEGVDPARGGGDGGLPRPLAAANRIYPAAMERVGKSTMQGLKEALEALGEEFP